MIAEWAGEITPDGMQHLPAVPSGTPTLLGRRTGRGSRVRDQTGADHPHDHPIFLDAGHHASWVAGDEVYGGNPTRRAALEERGTGYVPAVACSHEVTTRAGKFRADTLVKKLPKRAWQKLSAGAGAKGHRFCDWAAIDLPHPATGSRQLLIRRNRTPENSPTTAATHPRQCRWPRWYESLHQGGEWKVRGVSDAVKARQRPFARRLGCAERASSTPCVPGEPGRRRMLRRE